MKCEKSPSIPLVQKKLFKVKVRENGCFAVFSQTLSFITRIHPTKIVDDLIIYKSMDIPEINDHMYLKILPYIDLLKYKLLLSIHFFDIVYRLIVKN